MQVGIGLEGLHAEPLQRAIGCEPGQHEAGEDRAAARRLRARIAIMIQKRTEQFLRDRAQMRLASRIACASREVVISRCRKHREPRHTGFTLGRGHQGAKNSAQYGVDLAPVRRRIAFVSPARPIEIARPSRRVDQRDRARIESPRDLADPLCQRGAGGSFQSAERDAFENQGAWRRANDREVKKILADVDTYEWSSEWPGKRPDELSDSLLGRVLYDGPCGCVAPLDAVDDG